MNLKEVRDYLDEDYWERGKTTGKSGYEKQGIDMWWNERFVEALLQGIVLKRKKVLDLGCAMGGTVLAMIHKGIDAYGIDLSEYAVNKGILTYPLLADKIWNGSAHNLSVFIDESFDFIISNQVFEHVPEELIPVMFSDIHRVMKPEAKAWVGLVFGTGKRGEEDPDLTHITLHPREWWHERLAEAGLIVDYSIDEQFRQHRLPDGYNFFETYQWHSFSFRKP